MDTKKKRQFLRRELSIFLVGFFRSFKLNNFWNIVQV